MGLKSGRQGAQACAGSLDRLFDAMDLMRVQIVHDDNIAGLRHDRIAAPMVLDGPMNGEAFLPPMIRRRPARATNYHMAPPPQ
jgi:hypothetical protein